LARDESNDGGNENTGDCYASDAWNAGRQPASPVEANAKPNRLHLAVRALTMSPPALSLTASAQYSSNTAEWPGYITGAQL